MNKKIAELQRDLASVRSLIKEAEDTKENLVQKEKDIVKDLEILTAIDTPLVNATYAWCRITNALIAKYKPMVGEDPNRAASELLQIQIFLLSNGFLTEKDLERAL